MMSILTDLISAILARFCAIITWLCTKIALKCVKNVTQCAILGDNYCVLKYLTYSLLSVIKRMRYISTGRPCVPNNEVRFTADAYVTMLTIFTPRAHAQQG